MLLPQHNYLKPASLDECLKALSEAGEFGQIVAGGTDVIFNMRLKLFRPKTVISIRRLPELARVEALPDGSLRIGAQVAEVTVDPETGEVRLHRMTVAHDLGRAINPLAVEGQIDGQVFSGMSQALYEECETDDGQFLNPSRLEYKMPRTYEMPEVEYIIVESIDPYGPFGAKEVGEGPIVVTVGAIAAAVSNAVGAFIPEMPMTPWKVLRVIRQNGLHQ